MIWYEVGISNNNLNNWNRIEWWDYDTWPESCIATVLHIHSPNRRTPVLCFLSVNVKWGKEKFDAIELNTEESPMVFKAQLFALTGVQPARQKVMVKGGTLKVQM